MLATRVKTVNTQPGGKTVGDHHRRYRLRRGRGIGAHLALPNPGSRRRADETSFGTRGSGVLLV